MHTPSDRGRFKTAVAITVAMDSWTERYRPRTLDDIVGNGKAVAALREWAAAWHPGADRKAAILAGPPGVGKTSAALALAHDMGWSVVEMNASDTRNADRIRNVALRGAIHGTFSGEGEYLSTAEGGRKLIVLDEADNLYEGPGGGDRGGKRAIIETIRRTRHPIVLIANDLYELTRRSGAPLKSLCVTIRFTRVPKPSLRKAIRNIAETEGHPFHLEALEAFIEHVDGDMRSAVNDLETLCRGLPPGGEITAAHVLMLGSRDERKDVFEVLSTVFKTTDPDRALEAYRQLDEPPDRFLLWVEENVPYKYTDPEDLARAFDAITRADIILNRARRTQDYSLWPYAIDLITAGVALSKRRDYRGYVKYRFPSFLTAMGARSGGSIDRGVFRKIGGHTHASIATVRSEIYPSFGEIFRRDDEFAAWMIERLRLTREEVEAIRGTADVDAIMERAGEIATERQRSYTGKGIFAFDSVPEV